MNVILKITIMNMMKIVAIGFSLEEIIISCGGTLIKNIKNGGDVNIIVTNRKGNTKNNRIQKIIENTGIEINKINDFDFLITTQNNVNLIQKEVKKHKPDTIIIPHNKSKKKKNSVLGSSSILAGRQIKNILMYETEKIFDYTPTVFQNIENVSETKKKWINTFNKNQRNAYELFLKKVYKINKKKGIKQKEIESYHSFRWILK